MGIISICLTGLALSMDVFAASICKSLGMKKIKLGKVLKISLIFSLFQVALNVVGYYLGVSFEKIISTYDHWVAFILLMIIGFSMLIEGLKKENISTKIDLKSLIVVAFAVNIDALIIGITFSSLKVDIFAASIIMGIISFIMSIIGIFIGHYFGKKSKDKAKILGGIILIAIGIKTLLEHLNIL